MTFSLDAEFDDDGEATLLDTIVDESVESEREFHESSSAAVSLIQSCINNKKIVEAIILDTIAFNDVQKTTKKMVKTVDSDGNNVKYSQTYSEFWSFRCVQILSNLPVDYASYFKKHYRVLEPELNAAIAAIRAANNQKLYRYLAKTLKGAQDLVQFA